MQVRKYRPEDLENVLQLFRDTVRSVNRKHYSAEQTAVWSRSASSEDWETRLREGTTYIAVSADAIIAFGVLTNKGWLDLLYTHQDFQGKGAGSALMRTLEKEAKVQGMEEVWTEASITAEPFFASHGYEIINEQRKMFEGMEFINYQMRKAL